MAAMSWEVTQARRLSRWMRATPRTRGRQRARARGRHGKEVLALTPTRVMVDQERSGSVASTVSHKGREASRLAATPVDSAVPPVRLSTELVTGSGSFRRGVQVRSGLRMKGLGV